MQLATCKQNIKEENNICQIKEIIFKAIDPNVTKPKSLRWKVRNFSFLRYV